ncbi:DNA methylase N-4 [Patescibacteria group bacterium]|nr:MAG: DNA methylase N-4 [Patescibacteria group bacterium]
MTYEEFVLAKNPRADFYGFEPVSKPHPSLFPHQTDIARWMCRGGRRACFAAFGLGKTRIHLQVAKWICEKEPAKKYLIIAPLGVRQQFTKVEAPTMGCEITYCRNDFEVRDCKTQIIITNYERVRDGGINVTPEVFSGLGLDEASVLRSFGSKTYQQFLKKFNDIAFRFVFTATPSPNRHKELIHYGGFLGVMDTGDALTRFFKRDSTQANNLTLYPHMEAHFWLWLSSWSVFMQLPSDLGYSDEGYVLPPIKVSWHCVPVDHHKAWRMIDSWGQRQLFLDKSSGLSELAEVKRDTMVARVAKAQEIIGDKPDAHFILWHDLEVERHLINKVVEDVKCVYGSEDLDEREERVLAFERGEFRILAAKPILCGSGCNFQRHCSDAIFLGSTYKFNDFIQAVHRIQRFQQPNEVNIHVIYSESEDPVIETLKQKWAQHNKLVEKMSALLREFKLDLKNDMKLTRTIGCNRIELTGEKFRAIHNDCILELTGNVYQSGSPGDQAAKKSEAWPADCVDLILSSIPFGTQYEYSPSFNDLGHNADNQQFFRQMDFLIPSLLRVLRPGRIAAIHVKDRIRFGNVTGIGFPTVDRFSDQTADAFIKHGFHFIGRITIDTDVVRENNQTYRLGWTENSKDSSKMGVGMPEYVLLFRKAPTDQSDGYADLPVTKDKTVYTRAKWQIDASSFWRSNGDRLPDPEILLNLPMDKIGRIWKEHCATKGYDYNEHVNVGRELEKLGKLPASFMLFPPISLNPDVWTDIARMRVLNSEQGRRNLEKHVCPLQLDIVNRLIERYTNPNEIVLDPFAGIFTVPYCAIHLGRQGWGIELSAEYFDSGAGYCEQAEAEHCMPTLFDLNDHTKIIHCGNSKPKTKKRERAIAK